ncbi:MAG: uridine kinase [Bacteriovoracia bacterium]
MPVTGFTKPNNCFILGVAGGSGSGKTYFAKELHKALGDHATIVYQDNFYIDQSHRFDHDGGSVNFDHPESLDLALLATCLAELKTGQPTKIPIYDFKTHSRLQERLPVAPTRIIIVDGILIFHPDYLRAQFDEMVFFDTPESLRFERRLERDVVERGRTVDGVKAQFLKQVKPMHDQFVEPSKVHAHTIVKDLGDYKEHFEAYKKKLLELI